MNKTTSYAIMEVKYHNTKIMDYTKIFFFNLGVGILILCCAACVSSIL